MRHRWKQISGIRSQYERLALAYRQIKGEMAIVSVGVKKIEISDNNRAAQ